MGKLKKFNEIISEEILKLKKSDIKRMIKSVLKAHFRNVKVIDNGYSFEKLLVFPVIIDKVGQHTQRITKYKLTFEITDNSVKFDLSNKFGSKEKIVKINEKLEDALEKTIMQLESDLESEKRNKRDK